MLEKTERTVIEAPFRPFPRSLWHGELTLMPLPPWFITHRGQEAVAQRLVDFLPSAALAQIAGAPLARAAGLR
ncbi:aldehyde dehydrogenase [Klebsiella pneumoniae]|nr:aldehyde dehydrogenase [Klebsiella pneumoniae]